MHSDTVTLTLRLHHNNEPDKAKEALIGLLEDWVAGHTEIDGTEIEITNIKVQP